MKKNLVGWSLLGLLAVVGSLLAPSETASASDASQAAGVQLVRKDGPPAPLGLAGFTTAVVDCPDGWNVIGIGYTILPFSGAASWGQRSVSIRSAYPERLGSRWRVTVVADHPKFGTPHYSIVAYAYCSTPLSGYRVAVQLSDNDPVSEREVRATCPAGQVTLGGGFRTGKGGASAKIGMDSLIPETNSVLTKAFARGIVDAWFLDAYAFCVDPLPYRINVANSKLPGVGGFAEAKAQCPLGSSIVGPGFDLVNSLGEVRIARWGIDQSFQGGVGWASAAANEPPEGVDRSWTVQSFAVCVAF